MLSFLSGVKGSYAADPPAVLSSCKGPPSGGSIVSDQKNNGKGTGVKFLYNRSFGRHGITPRGAPKTHYKGEQLKRGLCRTELG